MCLFVWEEKEKIYAKKSILEDGIRFPHIISKLVEVSLP